MISLSTALLFVFHAREIWLEVDILKTCRKWKRILHSGKPDELIAVKLRDRILAHVSYAPSLR